MMFLQFQIQIWSYDMRMFDVTLVTFADLSISIYLVREYSLKRLNMIYIFQKTYSFKKSYV